MTEPRLREAARVITLDDYDRVLLLRYDDTSGSFWATPDGSLEPGEDHPAAARRGIREELGIDVDDVDLGPHIAHRSYEHHVAGQPVLQVERYYIAHIHGNHPDPTRATNLTRSVLGGGGPSTSSLQPIRPSTSPRSPPPSPTTSPMAHPAHPPISPTDLADNHVLECLCGRFRSATPRSSLEFRESCRGPAVRSAAMRTVRGGISFGGLIRAAGAGAYLGAAVAGLLAVLTGHAFAAGSPWPAGAPVLALLGAAGGWLLARLTHMRLAPKLSRRTLVFTVGGFVSFPLAVAIGQLHQVDSVGIALVVIAGCASILSYVTGRRRRASQRAGGRYARAAQ